MALSILLLLIALATGEVQINMYNGAPGGSSGGSCDDSSGGGSSSGMDDKCGGQMHFHILEWMPWEGTNDNTGVNLGAVVEVAQAVCDAVDVECLFSHDLWEKVWSTNTACDMNCTNTASSDPREECQVAPYRTCHSTHSAGDAMVYNAYDFALAWVTAERSAALKFSNTVFGSVPHVLIGKSTPVDTGVSTFKIGVQCGWADITLIENTFSTATVDTENCAANRDAQLKQVFDGVVDAAAFVLHDGEDALAEACNGLNGCSSGKVGDSLMKVHDSHHNKAEWEFAPLLSFVSNKKNTCKINLFNKGLEAIKSSGKYAQICDGTPLALCCGKWSNSC